MIYYVFDYCGSSCLGFKTWGPVKKKLHANLAPPISTIELDSTFECRTLYIGGAKLASYTVSIVELSSSSKRDVCIIEIQF
jgi:hypothetical protein